MFTLRNKKPQITEDRRNETDQILEFLAAVIAATIAPNFKAIFNGYEVESAKFDKAANGFFFSYKTNTSIQAWQISFIRLANLKQSFHFTEESSCKPHEILESLEVGKREYLKGESMKNAKEALESMKGSN